MLSKIIHLNFWVNYSFTFCDEVLVFRFDSSKFGAVVDTILTQASRAQMVIGYFLFSHFLRFFLLK